MWFLLGLLACHHTGSTKSPAPAPAAEPEVVSGWSVPAFTKVEDLGEGPVAFHPTDAVLAQGRGAALRQRDAEGAWQSIAVPSSILDLDYAADGALWVLDGHGLSVFDGANLRCRNDEVEAERLLLVDANGAELMAQSYLDGTGVVAVVTRVGAACESVSSEVVIPPLTVVTVSEGRRWQAFAAAHSAGPTKTSGPTLSWDQDSPISVFSAAESWPESVVVSGDRAMVVDESGAWELWDSTGPTRIGHGKAGFPGVELSGEYAAVGRDVVEMGSGAVQPGVLPAAVVARSSVGTYWVMGEGASTALFLASSP